MTNCWPSSATPMEDYFIHYSLEDTSTPNIKALRTGQVQARIHESQQLVQQTPAFNQ